MRQRKLQQEDIKPPRRWRRLKGLAAAAVGVLLLYGLGFLWFTTLLPTTPVSDERSTDAIVVLTGGRDRLGVPPALLRADKAGHPFRPGRYPGVHPPPLPHPPPA